MAYTNRICTNNYLFHSFVYFFLQSLCHMSLVGTSLGFLLWHCCLEIAALPHLHMLHSRFSVKIVRCSVSMHVNVNHCVCMWIQCVLMNIHVQYDNKCQFTPSRSFRNVECHQTILSFRQHLHAFCDWRTSEGSEIQERVKMNTWMVQPPDQPLKKYLPSIPKQQLHQLWSVLSKRSLKTWVTYIFVTLKSSKII